MEKIDVNIQNTEGFSALICAAEQGYTEVVKELLEVEEIDVFLRDNAGASALSAADDNASFDIVQILRIHLEKKVNENVITIVACLGSMEFLSQ